MLMRALHLVAFLLLAILETAKADDWVITTGKGSLVPDKAFSDQVAKELDSRGLDWGPWTALEAVDNPGAIPTAGKQLVSPDQKFSVQTTIEDSQFYFVIKDAPTGVMSRVGSPNFPVLALAWSPDSKSLVAVVHSPMTSFIKVIHWDGSIWEPFDVFPPESGDDDKFHVVGWDFKTKYLEAIYIVDHRSENGPSLDLYRCTFYIDPASGTVRDAKKVPITQREFISLRSSEN